VGNKIELYFVNNLNGINASNYYQGQDQVQGQAKAK